MIQAVQTTSNGVASGITLGATWTGDTSTGNLIVVSVLLPNAATGISITDSQTNTYTQINTITASATFIHQLWYAYNIVGGTTPTVTISWVGIGQAGLVCREYSGATRSDPLDKQTIAAGVGGTASSGNTAVTTFPWELVVGGIGSSTDPSVGTGYSNYFERLANTQYVAIEEKQQISNAIQAATFGGTTGIWGASVATFKAERPSFRENRLRPAIFTPGLAR